jgi:hypothetical protein
MRCGQLILYGRKCTVQPGSTGPVRRLRGTARGPASYQSNCTAPKKNRQAPKGDTGGLGFGRNVVQWLRTSSTGQCMSAFQMGFRRSWQSGLALLLKSRRTPVVQEARELFRIFRICQGLVSLADQELQRISGCTASLRALPILLRQDHRFVPKARLAEPRHDDCPLLFPASDKESPTRYHAIAAGYERIEGPSFS